ncbi:NAD(P)H oxidoreductase RTN4IP1, mitochondrial-like [Tubulanus polymorphus]|uniref:NAD(P)H oxidoreductase RTN4IP1, mitochondrial-like n=1 Tax=Tubulanus polymorphus TaxID=672921 RepID=UPI003DA6458E
MKCLIRLHNLFLKTNRHYDAIRGRISINHMSQWQIKKYGKENSCLNLEQNATVPHINNPTDVLIQVYASSINPLDVLMRGGYGAELLNILRLSSGLCKPAATTTEFPLTLGRDFSGTVIDVGKSVNNVNVGDQVWGAIAPYKQGTHADYVVACASEISKKPQMLDHINAAALPYVSVTSINALCSVGGLSEYNCSEKKVLVFGGSGGVGSTAIQILKSWNAFVATTCASDAVEMVTKLGADLTIDYQTQDIERELVGGFDFVLDTVGTEVSRNLGLKLLRPWMNAKYVSIVTPLLKESGKRGVPLGIACSAGSLTSHVLQGAKEGKSVRWSFFQADGKALGKVSSLVDKGKIFPVVESVFDFKDVPSAFNKLEAGHARGKTVIRHR